MFTDQTSLEKEIVLTLPDPDSIAQPITFLTTKQFKFLFDMELMRRLHNRDLGGQVSWKMLREYVLGYALRKY